MRILSVCPSVRHTVEMYASSGLAMRILSVCPSVRHNVEMYACAVLTFTHLYTYDLDL